MQVFVLAAAVAVIALWSLPAQAESLRCTGGIASEGDSRLSVAYKCGQPLLKDSFCEPVYQSGSLYPVPQPWANLAVPCLPIDEWLYDRGEGYLKATVRFRGGVVQSIVYGQPR